MLNHCDDNSRKIRAFALALAFAFTGLSFAALLSAFAEGTLSGRLGLHPNPLAAVVAFATGLPERRTTRCRLVSSRWFQKSMLFLETSFNSSWQHKPELLSLKRRSKGGQQQALKLGNPSWIAPGGSLRSAFNRLRTHLPPKSSFSGLHGPKIKAKPGQNEQKESLTQNLTMKSPSLPPPFPFPLESLHATGLSLFKKLVLTL